MEEHIGSVLVETYRIERLIGEGGMGRVYEASHLRLPKRFAVKMLNLSMLGNLEALLRFRREAEIVATLDHPSIVTLLDYNLTEEGVPYVVLEYLDGEHLGKRLGRGPLSLGEAMRIVVPVAQALHSAHQKDIVHRDLKPENIIILRNEGVKVVDFGIAKIRGGMELTGVNTILGTVPYMAPEQLVGGKVDARADQFALGAIVFEMLTGEMAFGAPSVPAAAARVAHHHPPPITGLPDEVNQAIGRALSKRAEERFPSVEAFMKALVEAASRREPTSFAELADEEGLPPLAGEATAVSRVPLAPPRDEGPAERTAPSPRVEVSTARTPSGSLAPIAEGAPAPSWDDDATSLLPAVDPLVATAPQPPVGGFSTATTQPRPRAPASTVLTPQIIVTDDSLAAAAAPGALLKSGPDRRLWLLLFLAALAGIAAGFWLVARR